MGVTLATPVSVGGSAIAPGADPGGWAPADPWSPWEPPAATAGCSACVGARVCVTGGHRGPWGEGPEITAAACPHGSRPTATLDSLGANPRPAPGPTGVRQRSPLLPKAGTRGTPGVGPVGGVPRGGSLRPGTRQDPRRRNLRARARARPREQRAGLTRPSRPPPRLRPAPVPGPGRGGAVDGRAATAAACGSCSWRCCGRTRATRSRPSASGRCAAPGIAAGRGPGPGRWARALGLASPPRRVSRTARPNGRAGGVRGAGPARARHGPGRGDGRGAGRGERCGEGLGEGREALPQPCPDPEPPRRKVLPRPQAAGRLRQVGGDARGCPHC